MKKAVILLNMGGAENLDSVAVFLKNMFNDKYILTLKNNFMRKILANLICASRLKQTKQNYEKIGGCSPIYAITRELVSRLNSAQSEYVFDYAMNYTPPFASDVLSKYTDYEITLFPLYPHHSTTTITSSLESAIRACENLKIKAVKFVDFFYQDDEYNDIIVKNIRRAGEIGGVNLIFSAHSLPISTVKAGDLYQKHVEHHVKILRAKLPEFTSIHLAYQSRLGPVKWLEPGISDVLASLKDKRALIYPISFCIDNSETDFELNIFYRELAKKLEFTRFEVVRAPNSSDEFVKFILNKLALAKPL